MTVYSERIKPTDYSIISYLEDLTHKRYQIPTFQREVVWSPDSVKKLWDSIYRFYPIGSILIWKTDLKLQNHRSVGGHVIADSDQSHDFKYILDGQQRTTSLLTSLYGGTIEGREGFDPFLYVDLTIEDVEENDENNYKERFLFWNEIDDRNGTYRAFTPRMKRYQNGLIVKIRDVMHNFGPVEKRLHDVGYGDYDNPVRKRLRSISDVLSNYRISFIELKGIEVSEVCQIFERINQEGEPLDIFDIVVAKTFRLPANGTPGFYLREMISKFREDTGGSFVNIPDIWYLEMLATLINRNVPDTTIYNITPVYLTRIKTEYIEAVWGGAQKAIKRVFDFFDNHIHLKGPRLIANRYFFQALVSYFYENSSPSYDLLKKFFWFVSFHNEDLMNSTTSLLRYIELLNKARQNGDIDLGRFLIDKQRLRESSYNSKGRLSTAILALLANQQPCDWTNPDRQVLNDVYYLLTDKPNLHHIFPSGYISSNPGKNKLDVNSLMNIAYLPQITNLKISDRNPIDYLRDFDINDFDKTISGHLMPLEILKWARQDSLPENGLDRFIDQRVDIVIAELQKKLGDVTFDVIDTREAL
jgi:hypothetical protein